MSAAWEPLPLLARRVAAGELAPDEPLERAVDRWRASEGGEHPLGAFITPPAPPPSRSGPPTGPPAGPLAGVPIALKDNLVTLDLPTTCASRILDGYRSPFEATAVERLRAAGALIAGKTNLDEFAMGSSTEHSAFGATRNPHDRQRVPGGSSGGSAAAVAAGIVPVALGSETGGSVRQPAAFCGVVGLNPTRGRVSRYGLVAFASSLDQVGVLGTRVADVALVLQTIAGADPRDATCVEVPPPRAAAAGARGSAEGGTHAPLEGVVIGVPDEYLGGDVQPAVLRACRGTLRRLEALGAELREVSLPHTPLALPAYLVIAAAEASSNLARYDGLRFGARAPGVRDLDELYDRTRALFGAEARRRVLLGTHVLSAGRREKHFDRAARARALVVEDFELVFRSGVHALLTPTTPGTAFRLGERLGDPVGMALNDAFTVASNLAGLPALSLPVGEDGEGLPVGAQLIAPAFAEETLFRLGAALEADLAGDGGV